MRRETIEFINQAIWQFAWGGERKEAFAPWPLVEVWAYDADGRQSLQRIPVTVDAPYPDATTFTVDMGGPVSGFIVLT